MDDPPSAQFDTLLVVLLKDCLDVLNGVMPILVDDCGVGLAYLYGAADFFAALFGDPSSVLECDLLAEEFFVYLVQLVWFLSSAIGLDVETTLEVFEFLPVAFLLGLFFCLCLLIFVKLQLRQYRLSWFVVRRLFPSLRHIKGCPQSQQILRNLLLVLMWRRGLFIQLNKLSSITPRMDVYCLRKILSQF